MSSTTKLVLPVLPLMVTKLTVVYRASEAHILNLTFSEKGIPHGKASRTEIHDHARPRGLCKTALLTLWVAQSQLQHVIEFRAGGLSRPPQS